jgi:hypothetical protein
MVLTDGGVKAAKSLLNTPTISEGFAELILLNRIDLSVEALVLQPEWRGLFTDVEIDIARKRLREVGYRIFENEESRQVPFRVGERYTRRNIQRIIGVPQAEGEGR